MKRVIVIVLLAIILAMLMSRRENLTAKKCSGQMIGNKCYTSCPPGYRADGTKCIIGVCPANKKNDIGDGCCRKNNLGHFVDCIAKTATRPSY